MGVFFNTRAVGGAKCEVFYYLCEIKAVNYGKGQESILLQRVWKRVAQVVWAVSGVWCVGQLFRGGYCPRNRQRH